MRLACIFVVIQFGLHAWFAGSAGDVRVLMPHAVAWVLDVFLLGILAGALLGVGVLLPGGRLSRRLWISAGSILIFLAGRELPEARESILTVGSTERWVYGEITPNGDYLFIDNDTGSVLASHGIDDAKTTYERFQCQLNEFVARYQR